MTVLIEARKLADYISSLDNFTTVNTSEKVVYNHIAALYTDIVLQSGLNYRNVVLPRVRRIITRYPETFSIPNLRLLLEKESLSNLMDWSHSVKIDRMKSLIQFSIENGINTEIDLKRFLLTESNRIKFLEINGVGPKTLDYTLKLLNFDTIAVDRHITSFIQMAGLGRKDYFETKNVVEYAADLLNISRSSMDASIWHYMSRKNFQTSEKLSGQMAIGFS